MLQDGLLASGSRNVTNGLTIKTLTGHTSFVFSLAVLKDDSLARGSLEKTIRIWSKN